jgi:CRISPR-associated endonuclease/helicase Cas3
MVPESTAATPQSLSGPACVVWAKSEDATDGWLPLHRHMTDTAAIVRYLWLSWLPARVRELIASDFGGDLAAAERCVVWFAAAHDLGKATPAFAMQNISCRDRMMDAGFEFRVHEQLRSRLPHSLASQLLLRAWLVRRHGFSPAVAETYAVVPGSHHGVTPSPQAIQDALLRPQLLGESEIWRTAQDELAAYAASVSGIEEDLSAWSSAPLSARNQVLMTAIVILADWLASDETRFPYSDQSSSANRAREAWSSLSLPPAWHPEATPADARELFLARFALPEFADIRPVQAAAIRLAHEVVEPGLMIIEAPMGEGKTEAALAVAEVFADRTDAGGCFVALPTMATSDAMFTRVRAWVDRLSLVSGASQTMFLAHGKATLNEEYRGLARTRRISAVGNDEGDELWQNAPEQVVIASEWLTGRKKGPLANFVVGTVDQVLFGSLKSRHLMLRHLALANKIVVIDEVHAYDVYMNVYLDRILGWLGYYGVPVILLSATLPSSRRRALVDAYSSESGSGATLDPDESPLERKRRARARLAAAAAVPSVPADLGYPLITASSSAGVRTVRVDGVTREIPVRIETMADGDDELVSLLEEALAGGGCAVVVRNTVSRAQQTMRMLAEHFGSRHTLRLAHSRFVSSDRARIDSGLRAEFGPPVSREGEGILRPASAIVVGTQVLEQSLDIDFDLLITDLAPTDLILQRIGRLHRHDRGERPPAVREARCVIVGVEDWAASPPVPVTPAGVIYDGYRLLRTLRVIERIASAGGMIRLPADIPELVEESYGEIPHDGQWRRELDDALDELKTATVDKEHRANSYLLSHVPPRPASIVGWQDRGIGDASDDSPGAQAQVRDTEDTLEVLVVRRVGEEIRTLPWGGYLEDRVIPVESAPSYELALAVAQASIRLPAILSKPWMLARVVGALEQNAFIGWQSSSWLRGQLVLVLDEELVASVAGYRLGYSRERGLEVERGEST